MRLQDFKTCLASLAPSGTYLLWGNETFFIDAIISRLKDLIFGDGEARATNCIVFYAADCQASEAVAAASTHPFLGQKSLVVVHNISDFSKGDLAVIRGYLEGQSPVAVFLLTDTTPHRYPMPSHAAIPKEKARLVDVSSPPPWDFDRWAHYLLSREKKRISAGALENLKENVGNNITTLAMEIEKLVCLAGDEKEIKETHTKALLGRSRTEREFALADAVASGDRTRALTVFSDLLREGCKIPKMFAIVRWQLENLWQAKEMLRAGRSSEDVSRELRIPRNRVGGFVETVNTFRVGDLRRALRLIMDAEVRSRSAKMEDRTVAEMLLVALCKRRPQARYRPSAKRRAFR